MNSMSPGPSEVSRPTRSPGFSSTGPEVVRSWTPISRAISMASVVLPRPGGPKNSVWSSVSPPALGGVDRDLERALHLRLPDELVQPRRPERRVGAGLFGQGVGGGDLELVSWMPMRAQSGSRLFPSRHRPLSPGVSSDVPSRGSDCSGPGALVVSAGTSFRLVVPQRVQFHSAVTAGTLITVSALPGRRRAAASARRISCEVSCGAPSASAARTASSAAPGAVAQAHQRAHRLLGTRRRERRCGSSDTSPNLSCSSSTSRSAFFLPTPLTELSAARSRASDAPHRPLRPERREQRQRELGPEPAGAEQPLEHHPLHRRGRSRTATSRPPSPPARCRGCTRAAGRPAAARPRRPAP